MEFFNNKNNDTLKFKINSEGINIKDIKSRLIFETKNNKNYIFYGKVDKDICVFDIPELILYEKGDQGKINFEIISDDLYFPVWNDKFEVKTKVNITLEKLVEETHQETIKKPSISTEIIIDNKPIVEKNEKIVKKEIDDVEPIKDFNDFFKD